MKDENKLLAENIGRIVMLKRKQLGINQLDLATTLGVARTSIVNIESGNQNLSPINMVKLCRLFGCTPSDLFPMSLDVILPIDTEQIKKQKLQASVMSKINKMQEKIEALKNTL